MANQELRRVGSLRQDAEGCRPSPVRRKESSLIFRSTSFFYGQIAGLETEERRERCERKSPGRRFSDGGGPEGGATMATTGGQVQFAASKKAFRSIRIWKLFFIDKHLDLKLIFSLSRIVSWYTFIANTRRLPWLTCSLTATTIMMISPES